MASAQRIESSNSGSSPINS